MAYSSADFLALFQGLLPTGPVWPRDPSAVQTQVLAALVPNYARLAARDEHLLVDAFPPDAVELLPEWEASLGLPDPCAGEAPTVQQRQTQVATRFSAVGGQSVAYLTAFAASLGFTIQIQQYALARYGRPNYGKPRYGNAWAFAWQVTTAAVTIAPAVYGEHRYGEPYRTWGGAVLECELDRIKPAHTTLLFNYTGGSVAGIWDQGVWGRDVWAA